MRWWWQNSKCPKASRRFTAESHLCKACFRSANCIFLFSLSIPPLLMIWCQLLQSNVFHSHFLTYISKDFKFSLRQFLYLFLGLCWGYFPLVCSPLMRLLRNLSLYMQTRCPAQCIWFLIIKNSMAKQSDFFKISVSGTKFSLYIYM